MTVIIINIATRAKSTIYCTIIVCPTITVVLKDVNENKVTITFLFKNCSSCSQSYLRGKGKTIHLFFIIFPEILTWKTKKQHTVEK